MKLGPGRQRYVKNSYTEVRKSLTKYQVTDTWSKTNRGPCFSYSVKKRLTVKRNGVGRTRSMKITSSKQGFEPSVTKMPPNVFSLRQGSLYLHSDENRFSLRLLRGRFSPNSCLFTAHINLPYHYMVQKFAQ